MEELLPKLNELIIAVEAKSRELSINLEATAKVAEQQAELAGILAQKDTDLKARELAVSKIEDVAAQIIKNEVDVKETKAMSRQLEIERDGYAEYLKTMTKEISDGHANLQSKIDSLAGEKSALEQARTDFMNEVISTRKVLAEERAKIDIDRQKVIAQMGK